MTGNIAQVVIDVDVAHLDRPFDYLVPENLSKKIEIGSLVRVKWGGRRIDGWVVGFKDKSEHKLMPVLSVVSKFPLFDAEMLETYRYVALRYAATLSQVLSVAIPKRHANAEKVLPDPEEAHDVFPSEMPIDSLYPGVTLNASSRIVAMAVPHKERQALASVLSWATGTGVRVIIVVPTVKLAKSLFTWLHKSGKDSVALITAEEPAADRYSIHLRAMRGDYKIVVGTMAAVWVPSPGPTMTIIWDEGNDLTRFRRTPQADVLDIAVARCLEENHGLIAVSYSRSLKAEALAESGWAVQALPTRSVIRSQCPRVSVVGPEQFEREGLTSLLALPDSAYGLIRGALPQGPVLVEVPGPGNIESVSNLNVGSGLELAQSDRFGAEKMAADLGRAFPNTPLVVSASTTRVLTSVTKKPKIVICTPGAEPFVQGGYSGVVVTEGHALAYSERLDAHEEALRRWFTTFSLGAPGAPCMLSGDIPPGISRALALWNPLPEMASALREREELGFFPSRWIVALDGDAEAVAEVTSELEAARLDPPATVVGTVALETPAEEGALFSKLRVRTIVACKPAGALDLMKALRSVRIARSLDRQSPVHVTLNPPELF